MDAFRAVAVPTILLFPPAWRAQVIGWIVARIALVVVAFWLGGCGPGS